MDLVYFEYKKQLSSSIVLTEEIMNFKLIVKLKELGVKVGLVSTSKREYIDIILKKLLYIYKYIHGKFYDDIQCFT